jgi:hypothetical protein
MSWRGTADEAVVYTAVAMICSQTGCDEDDALRRLIDRASQLPRTIPDMARLVIDGVYRFDV